MNIRFYKILPFVCMILLIGACKKNDVSPEQIEKDTAEYSRRVCPRTVNKNMVMDSVIYSALNPDNYYYYYTVSGIMDNDYELPVLIDGQRAIYLTNLKQAPEMVPIMDREATVHHVFISKSTGKMLYDLRFVSAEYNSDYISNPPSKPVPR